MGLFNTITATLESITPNRVRELATMLFQGMASRMPTEMSKMKENPKQYAVSLATNTKDLAAESLPLFITFSGIILIKYLLASTEEPPSVKKIISDNLINDFLLANVLSNTIQSLGTKFSRRLPFLAGPAAQQRASLEREFHAKKNELPEDFVSAIKDTFSAWDSALGSVINGTPVSSYVYQIRSLLDFPLKSRPRIPKKDFEEKIKHRIDDVIKHYDPVLQEQYAGLVREIIGSNINDSIPKRVKSVLLLGPSGTGKTTSVQKIAGILGIPVVLKKLAGAGPDDIMGTTAFYGSENGIKLGAPLTAILEAKKQSGYGTVILLLDELDKALKGPDYKTASIREFLIQILNSEVTDWESYALKVKFPLLNLIIIITGNRDPFASLECEEDKKAFYERLRYFNFSPYDLNAQLAIVMASFKQLKEQLSTEEQLNQIEGNDSVIQHLDEKVVHDIVEYNVKRRPGVRIALLVLQSYIAYVKHREYFGDWHAKPFSIEDQFNEYAKSENDTKSEEESAIVSNTKPNLRDNLIAVTSALSAQQKNPNDSNVDASTAKLPMLTALSMQSETQNQSEPVPSTLRHRRASPQSRDQFSNTLT